MLWRWKAYLEHDAGCVHVACRLVMATLRSRCGHYIFALWFLSSIFFFFYSSPNLSGRRLDVYHTFTHGLDLSNNWQTSRWEYHANGCGLSANLRDSLEIQDAKMTQKNRHLRTIAQIYRAIFRN